MSSKLVDGKCYVSYELSLTPLVTSRLIDDHPWPYFPFLPPHFPRPSERPLTLFPFHVCSSPIRDYYSRKVYSVENSVVQTKPRKKENR